MENEEDVRPEPPTNLTARRTSEGVEIRWDVPARKPACLKPWCGVDGKLCVDCASADD
jgi:hypothetical protein